MKRIFLTGGFLFTLVIAGCTVLAPGNAIETALPDPAVRVVDEPDPTTAESVEPSESADAGVPIPAVTGNLYSGGVMAFGLESHQAEFDGHAALLGEPGMTLMRHNGLLWHEVESVEGERDWTALSSLEGKLERAASNGLSTILIIRGTPEWAQQVPGSFCGPIRPEKLQVFADFVNEAVSRYSQAPYHVKYWEIGNEPDVDPQLVKTKSVFGCWGDKQDPYYGGGYYADMLKVVYPVIKNADPEAKELFGGLLLDCDPNLPPEGKDCSPGTFLEGVLRNGGGDFFDIISFHGYTPYFGPTSGFPNSLYLDEYSYSWQHMGGGVVGKINYIRQILERFQVDKPILHTEGALLCPEYNPNDCSEPDELFYDAQADYAVRLYARNWANGLIGTIWYQFEGPGWRYGGLLDEDQNPKPVYAALQFMVSILSGTTINGDIGQIEGLQGYEFSSPEKRVWVLWSPEQVDVPIQLPENPGAVYDKFGNQVIPEGNILQINSPIYIEFSP